MKPLPYLLPWVRVLFLIRSIASTTWGREAWPEVKPVFRRALEMRRQIAREGCVEHDAQGAFSFAARVLLQFCRTSGTPEPEMGGVTYEAGNELRQLEALFPDLHQALVGKTVIDVGCGLGYQVMACAAAGAREVIGVDASPNALKQAAALVASRPEVRGHVRFAAAIPPDVQADVIISQNSAEHWLDPEVELASMRTALAPGGKIFLSFGPPWYAPWGAHMQFFCHLPWVQLLFSERAVMEVRTLYRTDESRSYRQAGLGQISIARFEHLVASSGLVCRDRRYDCSKGLHVLARTPLRELFICYVRCVLMHRDR